ncbi:hypothetical protein V2E29_04515 [Streptomyces diastatochromogenes]|uniref:hypothetical protein n=1 Tax=Streptomyces diastatochromogenes TaxID=42236 RepID=UPI002F26BCDD
MPETPTETHVRRAEKGVDGEHPMYGWSVKDGPQRAVPHALLALVTEQQATNAHLDRIAAALAKPAAEAPAPEPKRRLWLPTRRTV